ncbi:MAG: ABC transporter ATP-binding protein [Chlamydiia bacterium]|nr:ABC transporter ATP-binding protein [Chlamydiia bacterium]
MNDQTKPLLEVKNLHTSFASLSKKVAAVRGASFSLERGETLGIVGESGSGKSVMAKSLTRLLPSVAASIDQGEILYQGQDLLQLREKELRNIRGKEIGMIFQDPMTSLNPTMRIGDQIVEGYFLHHPHVSQEEGEKRALELLERVGVSEGKARLKQYPHELSGGMRQRVMIAIAMISSPSILVADEPTTALDVTIQAQILELLKEIQQKEQMSILLITHDFSIVSGFCDRVLVMYAGEIVESATVDELFSSPKHPYTKRLLRSIPRLDLPYCRKLYTIEGSPPDLSRPITGCPFAERCAQKEPICTQKKPKKTPLTKSHAVSCLLYESTAKKEEDKECLLPL